MFLRKSNVGKLLTPNSRLNTDSDHFQVFSRWLVKKRFVFFQNCMKKNEYSESVLRENFVCNFKNGLRGFFGKRIIPKTIQSG
ncbi:hypothetical protein [Leptospira santarosai]|uniref:Uncharacterized protein n=1 Tax=Leptospira santarosai serovar Arenal str. MAVJ 401 TaxID=1049976 RepID=M6JTE8_9LEPT|nr:hypothetical protein [Leptospira santarosai]EMN22840.1 hypothetical protein LEP1GSC063_1697 [Leptospira santarosai serovar Arenal str. MAVJ 401]